MEKSESELKDTYARFMALGLALTYLGKQDAVETTLAALEVIPEPYKSMASTLAEICAYAGTGNVLKIQTLLHVCSEHYDNKEDDKKDDKKDKDKKNKDEKKEE